MSRTGVEPSHEFVYRARATTDLVRVIEAELVALADVEPLEFEFEITPPSPPSSSSMSAELMAALYEVVVPKEFISLARRHGTWGLWYECRGMSATTSVQIGSAPLPVRERFIRIAPTFAQVYIHRRAALRDALDTSIGFAADAIALLRNEQAADRARDHARRARETLLQHTTTDLLHQKIAHFVTAAEPQLRSFTVHDPDAVTAPMTEGRRIAQQILGPQQPTLGGPTHPSRKRVVR